MPVFLTEDKWSAWMGTSKLRESEVDQYLALLNSTDPVAGLEFHPVNPAVNSALTSGAELIKPIELGEPETLF